MSSSVPCYQLDANILLRFIHNDHKDHGIRAAELIKRANQGKVTLEVSAVIVAEIFYAMKASYNINRRQTAETLIQLFNSSTFRLPQRKRILDALARVQAKNVDFGDAYLAATAFEKRALVASFDRDLDKLTDVKRYEP